jgi:two-component system, sensor histidine kinase and response regulator
MTAEAGPNEMQEHNAIILLVDDDEGILESVADLLRLFGYTVITADNGATALPLLETHHPDLIISDIMMPVMSGYQLFDAVRSNPRWAALPFIFLTARGQHKDIEMGHRMGADAYLTKPFEPDQLVLAIENRLKRVRQITSLTEADVVRMKQELITVFSHELRTPLTYIVGYVNLLEEHRDLDPEMIDKMVVGIKRGSDRLVSMVEDLMLMIRIDSGVIAAEISDRRMQTQTSELIADAVGRFEHIADQRKVRIRSDIQIDAIVPCMPMYIDDALSRIISNAIKFCKRDGGHVLIQTKSSGDYLTISVRDDGIGITPGQQRALFERFQQIDRTQMEQQGIGLGLTIARSLVRLHGGDITVESVPGEGSTFTMYLPLRESLVGMSFTADSEPEHQLLQ